MLSDRDVDRAVAESRNPTAIARPARSRAPTSSDGNAFETMGIVFVGGRDFGSQDGERAALVTIVNEAFVASHFTEAALGNG